MNKIYIDNLPKDKRNKIIWKNTIGYDVKFIYDNIEGIVKIIDYDIQNQQIKLKYNKEIFNIYTSSFLHCKIGNIINKGKVNYKYNIGDRLINDKRDLTIIDIKTINTKNKDGSNRINKYYKYKCNKCGFDGGVHWSIFNRKYVNGYWILENSLHSGVGCSCCGGQPKIVVEHINSIVTKDSWMIPIINNLEFCKTHTSSSSDKIYPICSDCGRKSNKLMPVCDINRNKGYHGCTCGDGIKYPNKFMFNLLEQLHVKFINEYNPSWCKYKYKNKIKTGIYDFYIPSMNLIIEMDGGLGHGKKDNKMKRGHKIEESKFIDDEKDKLAKEHNIKVIRIDCDYGSQIGSRFNFIKQNVITYLTNLFDLSNIDWLKCNEYSCSNLSKKAYEYKKNNPNLSARTIANIMNYAPVTVWGWLKIWDNLELQS